MTTIPPLPIVDGWLFYDNSTLEKYQACARLYQYSSLAKRKPRGRNSPLNFGSGIHAAMEARYKSPSYDLVDADTEQKMFQALTTHFAENPQDDDEYRSPDLANRLVIQYNKKYMCEAFEVCKAQDGSPLVEYPFAFPILNEKGEPKIFTYTDENGSTHMLRVMYTGKIDLLLREHHQFFTLDHKTAFMFGNTFFNDQNMIDQHVGYCYIADRTIEGCTTSGYIVNAIRTRKPSKSAPDPTGEDFDRRRYYVTEARKQEWRRNTIALIEEILFNYSRQYMPTRRKSCLGKYGACAFYDICSLPEEQREATLNSGLFEDDTWSPLKEIPTLLKQ